MKLLQKVLLLPVSGQFGNHRWRSPGSLKVQENRRLSAGFGESVGSWSTHTHINPFLGRASKCGWCPKPCIPLWDSQVSHRGLFRQGIFIVPVPNTNSCAGWASCYRRSSTGDPGWEWRFLAVVPGSLGRSANEELHFQQSPPCTMVDSPAQGMPALSPLAVSLPQWCSWLHALPCVSVASLVLPPNITLAEG